MFKSFFSAPTKAKILRSSVERLQYLENLYIRLTSGEENGEFVQEQISWDHFDHCIPIEDEGHQSLGSESPESGFEEVICTDTIIIQPNMNPAEFESTREYGLQELEIDINLTENLFVDESLMININSDYLTAFDNI